MERSIDSAGNLTGKAYALDPEDFDVLEEFGAAAFPADDAASVDSDNSAEAPLPSAMDPESDSDSFAHPFTQMNVQSLFGQKADQRSLVYGILGGFAYFLAGFLCLQLARFDATLASVWLPNAIAVSGLFCARLRNELPLIVAVVLGSVTANTLSGTPLGTAAVFTIANLTNILVATWLTRRVCGAVPDLTDLSHLGYFLQYAGLVGPIASTAIAAPVLGSDLDSILKGMTGWFVAETLGAILVVPAVLLVARAWSAPAGIMPKKLLEGVALSTAGLVAIAIDLSNDGYSLMFLVPPITLMLAIRLGALGTALFVPGIAVVTGIVSYAGVGPTATAALDEGLKLHLIQAFIAANFLTGLPVAAILAGRERLTEELRKGRQELALLTEGITDAILLINLRGVCTYASPSVVDVLSRPPADFIGKPVDHRTHDDARDRIANALELLLTGRSEQERLTYRRLLDDDNGNPVFIEAECAVVKDPVSGQRTGIVVSARDVTERVELELLLTRARKSAEKAAKAKSEFLANMSHEIRTPMNGVLGFAELLREGDLSKEHRRHADMIVQSGRSMMMLLNDILDLSKIESGQVGIANEPVDVFATISECAALFRPTAEKKGLKLDFSITESAASLTKAGLSCGSNPWIKTDGLRLRQIVLNLLGNAVKFTEHGTVKIGVTGDEEEISITVADTGIGISKARLQTIFAPFTQGEGDTTRHYGGTGLGLTISRQLAELLGGTIEVESEAGVGSRFTLTLPATYTEAQLPEVTDEDAFEPSMLPQQAKILLVEDHDVNRLLVTEMLERCGQSVASAHDGNEAIAMVIDSIMRGKPYDLVLMDIQMPGCDGYAATRAIRAEGITPEELPIIALTANAFPEDLATARDAGMQTLLAKPLVFADLARALQRWLPTRIVDNDERGDRRALEETVESRAIQDQNSACDGPDDHITTEIVDISRDPKTRPVKIGECPPQVSAGRAYNASGRSAAQGHSPALIRRWEKRRREAVEAVRKALEDGTLGKDDASSQACEELATIIHKLAGTAAIFGEAELGDQAAALENALRMKLPADVRETLAFELLSVADDPADSLAQLED
ncbi:response regulator [Erythrobacter sp. SCSIO 43205]|uniref:ATP-binding protein n=1 Tax=Erythrobacter sp. SCSIO 43205 TaxID=2779361 RepID=UPI001CA9AA83|nr:ATP-binding protein [Erythrobacter sp. SCSIO 43205]UAB78795.1 response regulator [Erythrobacter sp. SCSIO 43205]